MAVFAIARREQFCRDAVIEFDHHYELKPRSDCDLQTARARSRSFQQAYGGRIALHGTDVATAKRRNTAPLAGEFSIAQACIKLEIRMHDHKQGTRH
jgi:hypothetical protein